MTLSIWIIPRAPATEIHALVSCMGKQQFVSAVDAARRDTRQESFLALQMTPSQNSGGGVGQID